MPKSKRKIEKEKTMAALGSRLKEIRNRYGHTRDRMADLMGIRTVTYDTNEKGRHIPTLFSIMSLDKRLGISIDWLLFGRGPMSRQGEQEKLRRQQELEAQQRKLEEEQEKDVFSREVEEMIETMKRVPLLRHAVMGYYQRFKIKNKELLTQHQQTEPQPSEIPAPNSPSK